MLGAIIGDTVGSIYEFNNTKDYNFTLFTSESGYTDDSIMTMAVAWWLLKDPKHRYETLESIMVDFAEHCPCPNGGYGEMFYLWLFQPSSLSARTEGQKLLYKSKAGRQPYGSWGNGSAMRVSAVGWFFDTLEETERVAKISAEITHNHPVGITGAQATAAAIWMARNGKGKSEIKEYIERKYGYDLNTSWQTLNETYSWDSSCFGTVPQSIICFLESTNFEDAIRKAVSIGGDSDTLACITGGIAEAYYGELPDQMIKQTERRFPKVFFSILEEMRENTSYGKKRFNLNRFIEGQRFGYITALNEIKKGRKESHWIWYVFPQLKGLGHSPNANYYGISGIEEAKQYLAHPILGPRLREISEALLSIENKSAREIFSSIDALKVCSCMTLFDTVSPNDIFSKVLKKYYNGIRDILTLTRLKIR